MVLGYNLKGKQTVEMSIAEFALIYKQGVSRQYILKLIQDNKLPEGVNAYKIGRAYIVQSSRKEDIKLMTKK